MTGPIETLLREIAALIKQSAAMKMRGHELVTIANLLRHKVEGLKNTDEKSKPQESDSNRHDTNVT